MFLKVILSIIDKEERNMCTKLLQSPQMVFIVNTRDVVTRAVRKDSREETEKNSKDQEDCVVVEGDDNQAVKHFKAELTLIFDIHRYFILPTQTFTYRCSTVDCCCPLNASLQTCILILELLILAFLFQIQIVYKVAF